MQYGGVTQEVLRRFPELKDAYSALQDLYDSEPPGQYIVIEDLLGIFIHMLFASGGGNAAQGKLAQIFDFVEEMLSSDDSEVETLGCLGVLYGKAPWWLREASPYLGERAQTYLDEYWEGWRAAAESTDKIPSSIPDGYGVSGAVRAILKPNEAPNE